MDPSQLARYKQRIEAELRGNILPFWMDRALDRTDGGYYGAITNDLRIEPDVPRTAVVAARILWAFSAAYRAYGDAAYLASAQHAYMYLTGPLWDPARGGVYWSVDRQGRPVSDRKFIYAQAFAIYGLSEYFHASGDPQARSLAHDLFHLVEAKSFDPVQGGNFEGLDRDWAPLEDPRLIPSDPHSRKSTNTLLHLMEAYTNLLRVWPDPTLKQKQAGLIAVFLDHILDPHSGQLRMFFDDGWNSLSPTLSFGHDIEAAWLLVEAADVQGDHRLLARARAAAVRLTQAVYERGRDADGSILSEGDFTDPRSFTRNWWGQCEGMVGFYDAYQLSGNEDFARAALGCWDFIEAHHVDRVNGDWFKVLDRQNHPLPGRLKVGPWECPYHHTRACLEMIKRLP